MGLISRRGRRSLMRMWGAAGNPTRTEHPNAGHRIALALLRDRAATIAIGIISFIAWAVYFAFACVEFAQAEPVTLEVAQLITNPHSKDESGHFIRVDGPASPVAYCAQGWLIMPKEGQKLERYGSLEIPELDYVLYHGYDGELVTSLFGLDEQKSEMATMGAVWLAIAEQRGDILNFTPNEDEPFHGNKMFLERWQSIEDEAIRQAARDLYDDALAYVEAGAGGIEEGCATFWSNKNPYGSGATLSYQGVVTADKDVFVTLIKTSADTQVTDGNDAYSLEGATYDIHLAETDEKVATATTDKQGQATCRLQPNTAYYAVETTAPAGYKLSSDSIPFTTTFEALEVTTTDAPLLATLKVRKTDTATQGTAQPGATLQGAEFTLTMPTGDTATAVTDETGAAVFNDVPLGTSQIVESKAPAGYLISKEIHSVSITADDVEAEKDFVYEYTVPNTPISFDIVINKHLDDGTDTTEQTDALLEGIAFDVISNTTKETVGTITTDQQGVAESTGSWFGAGERPDDASGSIPYDAAGYTIHEDPETTPEGFEPVDDWTVGADQLIDGTKLTFDVDNTMVTSQLRIVKVDKATGEAIPLKGFSFRIVDEQGEPVESNAWYPETPDSDRFTTDKTGSVTLPQRLRQGTYAVKEVVAPRPYLIAADPIPFTIDADSTEPLTVIEVPNAAATGHAVLTKTCAEDDTPLAGTHFDVIAQDDIVSPTGSVQAVEGEVVDQVVTDENGTAQTKELPLGTGIASYAFVETAAPEGYAIDTDPIPFKLIFQDDATPVVTTDVESDNEPTRVDISKTPVGENLPVEGAVFELSIVDGETTPPGTEDGTTDEEDSGTTETDPTLPTEDTSREPEDEAESPEDETTGEDDAEQIDLLNLDARVAGENQSHQDSETDPDNVSGDSVIDSTEPTSGSDTDPDTDSPADPPQTEGDADSEEEQEPGTGSTGPDGDADDVPEQDSDAESDDTTDPESQVSPSPEPEASDNPPDGTAKRFTTNQRGEVTISHLTPGTYRLQEVEAPDGYLVDDTTVEFTVDANGLIDGSPVKELSIENDFTKVEISKRSAQDESYLPGAQLVLYSEDDEAMGLWTSSEEPHLITKLAPGTYRLHEQHAPDGYEKVDDMEIVVEKTAEVQSFTLYNDTFDISGEVDKRQQLIGDADSQGATLSYTIDARSTSSTWVDEFTITDELEGAEQGIAELTGITTPVASGDFDGNLNVWYRLEGSDAQPETSDANATIDDEHDNPALEEDENAASLGSDQRMLDYNGWHLWAEGVSCWEATELKVSDLGLTTGQCITAIRFEFGTVNKGFTTRETDWDRQDLKDGGDAIDTVPEPDSSTDPSPIVIHMRTNAAYREGTELTNHVELDLYRSGGGDGLEAHDQDTVKQSRGSLPAIIPLDQTGVFMGGTALVTTAVCSLGAWLALARKPLGPIVQH